MYNILLSPGNGDLTVLITQWYAASDKWKKASMTPYPDPHLHGPIDVSTPI